MPIVSVNPELCKKKCSRCVDACPVDVMRLDEQGKAYIAYRDDCNSCLWCAMSCPEKAINVSTEISWPWLSSFYP
jgi:NAD-dependent dihydropyrimidine dehydrogenase PreA subunit